MPDLTGRPVLVAREVKQRLLGALESVWGATLAGLHVEPGVAAPEDVLFVVQLEPACVRVVKQAREGGPALELVRMTARMLPDDGHALEDATRAYVAGTLSALAPEMAEQAFRYAEAVNRRGGFLLIVRPLDGETRLYLAKAGEDLSTALDLGGIEEPVAMGN